MSSTTASSFTGTMLATTPAMIGDSSLFARQDGVEATWRVVDPILTVPTPLHEYEPGTWGPCESQGLIAPFGGWQSPKEHE